MSEMIDSLKQDNDSDGHATLYNLVISTTEGVTHESLGMNYAHAMSYTANKAVELIEQHYVCHFNSIEMRWSFAKPNEPFTIVYEVKPIYLN